ncbi:MAG: hypothetical protein ERJ67_05950 [Aphanocapsa feldmannii 277cV]|uniref:Uncharacterized protein n=2 Tax=Aphanocapsa feldmannii TaxID=192050 RepID=A0A524RN38_9CHRO|nr:MAG: hypothetical protein ERJ69_08965 [Aphanocapsa feldmannii 288cV]TGG92208.1 MAG: hypothetical protein ERJ67_05950 [Aphanocapsa feldmannii 277cV]TGH21456.1 MAG: hypothetical protein ERJ68_05490 [Aphanocapsa feldmannii 277cI]
MLSQPAQSKPSVDQRRGELRQQADQFHARARDAAELGDLKMAAELILRGLDCERRSVSLGPQVLQLIRTT